MRPGPKNVQIKADVGTKCRGEMHQVLVDRGETLSAQCVERLGHVHCQTAWVSFQAKSGSFFHAKSTTLKVRAG